MQKLKTEDKNEVLQVTRQILHQVLAGNAGNRITDEVITGVSTTVLMRLEQHIPERKPPTPPAPKAPRAKK